MQVAATKMVKLHYTLKDKDNNVIDSSVDGNPLEVMHGVGQMIPGFEKEINGLEAGAKKSFVVPAKDGYGEFDESLVQKVPRSQFDATMPIEVGQRFQADTATGPFFVRVTEVTDSEITVDGNHELAGKDLYFDVEIVDVRDPTEDELAPLVQPSGCGSCGGSCGDGGCGSGCGGCGGCGE